MSLLALLLSASMTSVVEPGRFTTALRAKGSLRAQLHCHSSESDGDVSPEAVFSWYRKAGFHAVALSDHDKRTVGLAKGLIQIPAVEISSLAGEKPVHLNALCASAPVKGERSKRGVREVLAESIRRSKRVGRVTMLNHPNFGWAIGPKELIDAPGLDLLEIASGHPLVNQYGTPEHPSHEALWDEYLTRKGPLWGAAVDDAHDFVRAGEDRKPGRAWVEVWPLVKNARGICDALKAGRFYATRGVRLRSITVEGDAYGLEVEDWNAETDRVEFIGAGGKVLATAKNMPAVYTLLGGERYVRARVRQGRDREAWTQPHFVAPAEP